MAFKFTITELSGYHVWDSRSIIGTVQNRRYRRTRESAVNDSLTQGRIDRAVKEFYKRPNVCVVAEGGHFN